MKSSFDFYESASVVDTRNGISELIAEISEADYDNWSIVQKSPRRWAAFHGQSTYLIPDYKSIYSVEEFISLK